MGEAVHDLSVQKSGREGGICMVGRSRVFLEALEQLQIAAECDAPVLLTGETGTGKELAATFIHHHSPRHDGPFVTLDCTVINDNLFESEVFGHERGAFTGSIERRKGLFELADGGTLLLDEIGELSPTMQAKLLRVLESGTFRRVGGRRLLHANVRTVCATNRNVATCAEAGGFRADLYYRIACLSVRLPSLRERLEDIPELAAAIIDDINAVSSQCYTLAADALELLKAYRYPGNVRELRNILFVAAVRSPQGQVDASEIAKRFNQTSGAPESESRVTESRPACAAGCAATLRDLEAQHIADLLKRHAGRRREVATDLGISERTLYRKLKRYALA
jgi:DNA-binding NtrC family response regulator